jgi:DNA-binding transcriptional LysR family regulator
VQLQALARGEIDAGFMLHSPGFAPGTWRAAVAREPLVLALPEAHPLAHGPQPRLAGGAAGRAAGDLSPAHRAVAVRRHLFGLYHAAGRSPQVVQEAIQMQTIVNLVSAGLGVAWVPASVRQFQRSGVVYREVRAMQRQPGAGLRDQPGVVAAGRAGLEPLAFVGTLCAYPDPEPAGDRATLPRVPQHGNTPHAELSPRSTPLPCNSARWPSTGTG